jgi:hypothetical protein
MMVVTLASSAAAGVWVMAYGNVLSAAIAV